MTCIIVDDDVVSTAMLEGFIKQTGLLNIVGQFQSAPEAVQFLLHSPVDLIFLDVEMPGMSGLELLQGLKNRPEVIMISGHLQYAVNAFDHSVADFILKPFNNFPRFLFAVQKVVERKKKLMADTSQETIYVRVDSVLVKVEMKDICWIEAFGDYMKFQTIGKLLTVHGTLKSLSSRLPSRYFVRVHRSFIINLLFLSNIDSTNVEVKGRIIPVSETYREALLAHLNII